jgi:hypothetical protein
METLPLHRVRTQQEGIISASENGPLSDSKSTSTLLGLLSLQNYEKEISVVYRPPSLWYFVIETLMDWFALAFFVLVLPLLPYM